MIQRIDWIDYGKGLGIILVVYAHLLSSGFHAGLPINQHFFQLSDSLVYSFHMPLFFFLAGLLVEESFHKKGGRDFFISKLKLIAYPYLVWSLLQGGAELIFSSHSSRGISPADILAIPCLPIAQFWFLYALLLMYGAFALFMMLGRFGLVFMSACALVLLFFPVKTDVLALGGFSTGFLFFAIGVLVKKYGKKAEIVRIPVWGAVFLFLVFMVWSSAVFERLVEPVRLPGGTHPWLYVSLALLGIAFCTGLAQFLAGRGICQPVRILGVYSLEIYLAHMLAGVGVRVVLLQLFNVHNPVVHMLAGMGAGLTVPILIFKVSRTLNFPYLFNPVRLAARG